MKGFHLDSCATTMDEARALLAKGEETPFFVRAEEQLKGRGQYGKSWSSLKGQNLLVSLAVAKEDVRAPKLVSLLCGLALADILRPAGVPALLAWPNDVVAGDAKIAGILVEDTEDAFVIGVGLNLNDPAGNDVLPDGQKRTSVTAFTKKREEPALWAERLAEEILEIENKTESEIVIEWQKLSAPVSVIRFKENNKIMEGFFSGLSDEGFLLLITKNGLVKTVRSSGEIIK